ncbi:family 10 glycosylhydrolase [Crocosphaera sp.]|uniref:glycoside hydrolase family 10 protein n=1 Tax=Crocosphaera sp. TaxID=2729996 RepID=UPI00263502D4|nr:family 10 glycosylhydrolase [Crocosphaera sp.]MDJ0580672.1 family 10 glycosylhydrolase [Crocosphaera sp.]
MLRKVKREQTKPLKKKKVVFSLKSLLKLLSPLIASSFLITPSHALLGRVGVVRSPENQQQWTSIRNRLLATGMQFCLLEAENWQTAEDLRNVRTLFLPNIETITGQQAEAIENLVSRGGNLIVSGPTGNLSESAVRDQLRALFGAYWGFSTSSPSTIRVQDTSQLGFVNPASLSGSLIGGVIIPSSLTAQPLAVWLTENKPPAVMINEQTIFLGWRWGFNGVTSAAFDVTWLKTVLNRYGINETNQLVAENSGEIPPCNIVDFNTPQQSSPILPPVYLPQPEKPQTTPEQTLIKIDLTPESSLPSEILISDRRSQGLNYRPNPATVPGISPQQAQNMTEELSNLIVRFESTLIASLAHNQPISNQNNLALSQSQEALKQAKLSLQQFQGLLQQKQDKQARQVWLKARRSLWDNYPSDRSVAQPEVRAMWLDRGSIVKTSSEAELAVLFDRMAEAGINTVFMETVNASYPIYPSKVAPEQNPLTKGWDPLKVAIKLAHERNMELHAWVWVFAAANQGHNKVLEQPKNYLGPVLSRNPDWGITDKKGNYFDQGQQFKKAFLDPANPRVQDYLLSLFDEIVRNYDVDGIQFDYIRYPFQQPQINQTFGYSKSSRYLFQEMTGVDPIEISPGHRLWNQWTEFRVNQVDSFVARASRHLKRVKPELIVSASVFPIEQRDRVFRLQQNWEEWMRQEWVDMIVLMTYALDTDNLEERIKLVFDDSLSRSALVIPGLRLLKVPDPVTIDQLQFVRNLPISGFSLFATENLTPSLQGLLSRVQSSENTQPLPYRQPFKTALFRYQSLQKEWRFLADKQRLKMDKNTLKNIDNQGQNLEKALEQLAMKPSQQNLKIAQQTLREFKQQFPNWMRNHKQIYTYQVQVWENRLETLDKLLVYGERKMISNSRLR